MTLRERKVGRSSPVCVFVAVLPVYLRLVLMTRVQAGDFAANSILVLLLHECAAASLLALLLIHDHLLQGIMESLEFLLESGFKPRRSFYLAFGHDEEASGFEGAREMARLLKQRNPKPLLFVLDEGTFILKEGTIAGVRQSIAL